MPSGNTYVEYTAGSSDQYKEFTFPYLESSHIIVNIDGTDWDEDSVGTFEFTVDTSPSTRVTWTNTTPFSGTETVRIYRNTLGKDNDDTAIDTTFIDGSIQTAEDLNKVIKQAIYLAVEKGDFEIVVAGATTNDLLKFNSVTGKWEADTMDDIDEIGNVSAPGPSNTEILQYNGSNWVPIDFTLNNLTDTDTPGPTDKGVLEYNSTSGKWGNQNRFIYDSGWVTNWNVTAPAANVFDSVTMAAGVDDYFPFEVRIWGRLASSPNEVYPLDSAVAQSDASGTVGIQVKYNQSTRDLTLYFQDVPVWHEVTSGIGSTLLWGTGIDEIRVTINR